MKSFTMKVEGDKIKFLDKEDRAAFQRLLFQIEKKGIKFYTMTIDVSEDVISDKQEKLFKVLINKVADASGQDSDSIEQTLLKNFGSNKSVSEFSKEDFQNFLECSSAFTIDFFGFFIDFDQNNHIQINKI